MAERRKPAQRVPDTSCPEPRAGTRGDRKELASPSMDPVCFRHTQADNNALTCPLWYKNAAISKTEIAFPFSLPFACLIRAVGRLSVCRGFAGRGGTPAPQIGAVLHRKAGGKREIPSCQEPWKRRWVLANVHLPHPHSRSLWSPQRSLSISHCSFLFRKYQLGCPVLREQG